MTVWSVLKRPAPMTRTQLFCRLRCSAGGRSAADDAAPPRNPALPYSLPLLEAKLRAMYKHVTEGKFSEGLRSADALLHLVPLTVRRRRRRSFGVSEFFFWF